MIFIGNGEIVDLLIKAGAYVNFRDDDSATALHRAVEQGLKTFGSNLEK